MRAYVLITTKPGTSEEVVSAIKAARNIKGVVQADSVYGRFDTVVVIKAEDLMVISEKLYKVIEKMPNIVHTENLLTVF